MTTQPEVLSMRDKVRILNMVDSVLTDLKSPQNRHTVAQLIERGLVFHKLAKKHAGRVSRLVELARRGQALR